MLGRPRTRERSLCAPKTPPKATHCKRALLTRVCEAAFLALAVHERVRSPPHLHVPRSASARLPDLRLRDRSIKSQCSGLPPGNGQCWQSQECKAEKSHARSVSSACGTFETRPPAPYPTPPGALRDLPKVRLGGGTQNLRMGPIIQDAEARRGIKMINELSKFRTR